MKIKSTVILKEMILNDDCPIVYLVLVEMLQNLGLKAVLSVV